MALYGISSERSFCEQLRYNMLFKWFVGLELDEEPFVATVFAKNRDRFMDMDIGKKLFDAVVLQASEEGLLSSEHFSVDGSLIEAAASMKSFRPKDEDDDEGDGNGWADFAGKRRSNATHESKTDPDCLLAKKGPHQVPRPGDCECCEGPGPHGTAPTGYHRLDRQFFQRHQKLRLQEPLWWNRCINVARAGMGPVAVADAQPAPGYANHGPKRTPLPSLGEHPLRTALRPMPARAPRNSADLLPRLDRRFFSSLVARDSGTAKNAGSTSVPSKREDE